MADIEIPEMAYTLEDFKRDCRRRLIEHLDEFNPEFIKACLNPFHA